MVGVFGGAFDPPHLGHVALIETALARFDLERLLVVPAGNPPHKPVRTAARTRFRLAELAFSGMARVEISRIELEPRGPRYTVDTLRRLSERFPELMLLVGADQLLAFSSWREPERILELARVAVASRPGHDRRALGAVLSQLAHPERVVFFQIPVFALSSEQIRARVKQGLPIDDAVPEAVAAEIARLGLYRD